MNSWKFSLLLLAQACLALTGCGSMAVENFADTKPELVLEDYFSGQTRAWGIFEDRFGNVQRQFFVDIDGSFNDDTLTLVERFVYTDGETEKRTWIIKKTGQNSYSGETENSIGTARGATAGNAFHWEYDFNLKVGDDSWKVHFDDWMFLQSDGVLLNKATVTRWGLKLGTVFISFDKSGGQAQPDPA